MRAYLKDAWYWLCRGPLSFLPDQYFIWLVSWVTYKRLHAKWYHFNLTNPITFNEKLNYLKLGETNALASVVADKVAVRDYAAEKVGDKFLVPMIGVYQDSDEIPFYDLPNQFVLKVNHGSGWNIICTDKSKLDTVIAKKKLRKWLNRNAWYLSRESQYKEIPPKIICEALIGENINDYKFFCSRGEPVAIQVDIDRFKKHKRAIFDTEWKLMDIGINYPIPEKDIAPPTMLSEMLDVARKLSVDFIFCRIDLYEVNGKIYFGEITLCPGGGFEPFHAYEQDLQFGRYIFLNAEMKYSRH